MRRLDAGPIRFPTPTLRSFADRASFERYVSRADPGAPPLRLELEGGRLVLLAGGPRSSTGYRVEVHSVVEQRRRILVRAREAAPRLGDPVQPVVTYPYALLRLPRGSKRVEVVWEGRP